MLYDYILKNYEKDEPIFLSELPGDSRDYVRQEMKKLVDDGKCAFDLWSWWRINA